uniref:HDC08744 n=1 Tax=Drosophila melanogaster TaxID=7227 RepID=Q6ILR2_DROME|nr:TPA_inf: HDC08744 [Drosophila melanogaster]
MNMKMKQPQLLPLGFFWFLLVNGAIEMAGQQQPVTNVATTSAATPRHFGLGRIKTRPVSAALVIFIKSRRVVLECKVNQTAHMAYESLILHQQQQQQQQQQQAHKFSSAKCIFYIAICRRERLAFDLALTPVGVTQSTSRKQAAQLQLQCLMLLLMLLLLLLLVLLLCCCCPHR